MKSGDWIAGVAVVLGLGVGLYEMRWIGRSGLAWPLIVLSAGGALSALAGRAHR